MQRALSVLLCIALFGAAVNADVYMQHPRGSNNRLDESNAERTNGDRLFDSQNNNRGGYNVGDKTQNQNPTTSTSPAQIYTENDLTTTIQYPMVYYEGSILQIEWTNQHGCGGNALDDPTLQNCNIVLQYACDNTEPDPAIAVTLRDGTTTDQVNEDGTTTNEGMHESVEYYRECKTRSRNRGLFTADQNMQNRNNAIHTRQDNNGDRQGLECEEERDYYPYWLPTPWIDIAYLTDRMDFCTCQRSAQCLAENPTNPASCPCVSYTFDNSENVVSRYKCRSASFTASVLSRTSQESCNSDGDGIWGSHKWNAPPMACVQAQWSRSNHLGNSRDTETQMMNYNWTLPTMAELAQIGSTPGLITKYDSLYVKCVLRMRYNISTDDYDPWTINATSNDDPNNNNQNPKPSPIKGNQQVDVGADLQSLQMSIDTDQFGRTFQDRSHIFYIRQRPATIPATAKVWNLNVRGKRGNIVQTYPANEYDFVPNRLTVNHHTAQTVGDFVHLQWTGSNTHDNDPNDENAGDGQGGDAGEGTDGTDRHNFVQIQDLGENFPIPLDKYQATNFFANTLCYKLDGTQIGATYALGTTNTDCAVWLATSGYWRQASDVTGTTNGNDVLNPTLNNAPPSLIGGVVLAPQTPGVFHYISSRNNNFSNRSQKGTLVVA